MIIISDNKAISLDNLSRFKSKVDKELAAKADKSEIPAAIPIDGGNADTVNGHTVNANVPADAKFTDTLYSNMKGATVSAAGAAGLVPAPSVGRTSRDFLSANATWRDPFQAGDEPSGQDLDNIRQGGVYFFVGDAMPIGAPENGAGWLMVLVNSISYVKQIWFRLNSATIYIRTCSSNVWGDWKRFATAPAAVNPLQIVNLVQGAQTIAGGAQILSIPYQPGATKALVEVWENANTTISGTTTKIGRTAYGSIYKTNMSSNMTPTNPGKLTALGELDVSIGISENGNILIAAGQTYKYRVTWLT